MEASNSPASASDPEYKREPQRGKSACLADYLLEDVEEHPLEEPVSKISQLILLFSVIDNKLVV